MRSGSQVASARIPRRSPPAARAASVAIVGILLAQAALGLYLGLPGQMSFDSVVQLYEGRTLRFISFNPPLVSVLLGALDRLGNAPVGFVLLSQAMLSGATALALLPANRVPTWRLGLAALVVLNPVVLCYVGIVWKDVLLAHAAVLVYFLIAWLRREGRVLTPALALLLLVLLTLVVGARQQGMLVALPAALWAATTVGARRRARMIAGIAFVALPIIANRLLDAYAADARVNPRIDAVSTGWRILIQYDLAGMLANGGQLPTGTPPGLAAEFHSQTARYSPYRVDTLDGAMPGYWAVDGAGATRLWVATIAGNPGAYLRHRTAHFAAVLGLADMHECLPLFVGVSSPVLHPEVDGDLTASLGLSWRPSRATDWMYEFGRDQANTPLFMHLAYALVLVATGAWLYRRRDYVLATLAACTLVFLASYAVLGIACDFRYAYLLPVVATLLTAYACLNAGAARDASRRIATAGGS